MLLNEMIVLFVGLNLLISKFRVIFRDFFLSMWSICCSHTEIGIASWLSSKTAASLNLLWFFFMTFFSPTQRMYPQTVKIPFVLVFKSQILRFSVSLYWKSVTLASSMKLPKYKFQIMWIFTIYKFLYFYSFLQFIC